MLEKNLVENGYVAQNGEYASIGGLYQLCHVDFAFESIDEPDLEPVPFQRLDPFYPPWHARINRRHYGRGWIFLGCCFRAHNSQSSISSTRC